MTTDLKQETDERGNFRLRSSEDASSAGDRPATRFSIQWAAMAAFDPKRALVSAVIIAPHNLCQVPST